MKVTDFCRLTKTYSIRFFNKLTKLTSFHDVIKLRDGMDGRPPEFETR
jgi:hypothetical protein